MIRLTANKISKRFNTHRVFNDISFATETGASLAVTGPNGSGKSTMIHILTGLGRPSSGSVEYLDNSGPIKLDQYYNRLALVAPYYELYDSLSARENLRFYSSLAGVFKTDSEIKEVINRVGLKSCFDKMVGTFSSGMKQRLKYALVMLRDPDILLLDEPTAYLDKAGKRIVFDYLNEIKSRKLLVIATNEEKEAEFADDVCQLGR